MGEETGLNMDKPEQNFIFIKTNENFGVELLIRNDCVWHPLTETGFECQSIKVLRPHAGEATYTCSL